MVNRRDITMVITYIQGHTYIHVNLSRKSHQGDFRRKERGYRPHNNHIDCNKDIHPQAVTLPEDHRRIRDVFRSGGGGGGGAEDSCPNILSIAGPKIKWFCPNIIVFFAQNGYLKNSRGGGGGRRAAAPWPIRRICLCTHPTQYHTNCLTWLLMTGF